MRLFIISTFLCLSIHAMQIENDSHIVVHANQYYHQQHESIDESLRFLQKTSGENIGLYQKHSDIDSKWYIPSYLIDRFIYSIGGKHNFYIDPFLSDKKITLSGGYFTNCLARAITSTMANFLQTSLTSQLIIKLPTKAIFTGHQIIDDKLVPHTAYQESILDDTIRGLNLSQVLSYHDKEIGVVSYLRKAFPVVFTNHAVMNHLNNYSIEVIYNSKQIKYHQVGYNFKNIKVIFY